MYLSENLLENTKQIKPLIHHITNYVTVNDCANVTLAIGASPVMADAIEEAADIASISSALVLNIGTINSRTFQSILSAGRQANKSNIPVILDPVGAGASAFRNQVVAELLKEVKISVLRGNISEIRCIAGLSSNTKGVDAAEDDYTGDSKKIAKNLSKELNCVVAITGAVDIVSDGIHTVEIHNGHPAMALITGTGCMCTSLIGSLCGASPEAIFPCTISAITCMGLAGERAYTQVGMNGTGDLHKEIINAISKMDGKIIKSGGKIIEI